MKKIFLLLILCLTLTACASQVVEEKQDLEKETMVEEKNYPFEEFKEDIQVVIKTNQGDIELEVYGSKAPITVGNFVDLINQEFYNNIKFHRVIADFMIQTGDPQTRGEEGVDFVYDYHNNPNGLPIAGTGGPGYSFEDETDNGLVFDKAGVLAMANSGPDTNGSQFFITHTATPWLNGNHTIFGQVISGQEVVDKIQQGDVIQEIIIK